MNLISSSRSVAHAIAMYVEALSFEEKLSRLACLLLLVVGSSATPALAASTDPTVHTVQYTSILDTSPSTILLQKKGFGTLSTYSCSVATGTCNASPLANLAPMAIPPIGSYTSPDDTLTITTTRVPGVGATFTLSKVGSNGILTSLGTIPFTHEISRILWATDGTSVFLMSGDGESASYNITKRTLTPITSLPATASWLTLSPNGRYLAYYEYATPTNANRTYGVLDTTLDKVYERSEPLLYWDLLTEGVRLFAFSPDSQILGYLSDRANYPTVYQVKLSALSSSNSATAFAGTPITTRPYTVTDFQWVGPTTLVFSANRDSALSYGLYSLNTVTSVATKVAENVSFDAPMQKIGSNILFSTADQNGRFPKLYHPQTKTVTSFSIPGTSQSLSASGSTAVTAGGLSGAWLKPSSTTKTLVVWLHGGPDRTTSLDYNSYFSYGGYDWVLNHLKNAGVAVLKLDYPGSVGHGRAFAESIKGGVGTTDVTQTAVAIQSFASSHGYSNVYLMGNSYGGYLALKLLTAYPARYQGAYSLSGVTDWQTLLTDIPSSIFSVDFNGTPNASNQKLYAAASIVKNLSGLANKKIILVQGDADSEVPYAQSTLLDSALSVASITHEFITLPGEDHIYAKPSSFTLICNKALEFVGLPDSTNCQAQ